MTTEKDLSSRVSELLSYGDNIPSELSAAFDQALRDPCTSLTNSRVCLEDIVKSTLSRHGVRVPPKAMLGNLLNEKLIKNGWPPIIYTKMNYVNGIASAMGPHKGGVPADARHAFRVLEELCDILEWYGFNLTDNFGNQIQENEKLIIYVSGGGTCRCAMANVITRHYLTEWSKLTYIRPMSCAFNNPTLPEISEGALTVLSSHFGKIPGIHQSIRLDDRYIMRADLILAMNSKLVTDIDNQWSILSKGKLFLFSEFFGDEGNIDDPYGNPPQIPLYKNCFKRLDGLISQGQKQLLDRLAIASI